MKLKNNVLIVIFSLEMNLYPFHISIVLDLMYYTQYGDQVNLDSLACFNFIFYFAIRHSKHLKKMFQSYGLLLAIIQLNYTYGYTGFWTHHYNELISLCAECAQIMCTVNNTTDIVNFVHHCQQIQTYIRTYSHMPSFCASAQKCLHNPCIQA